MGKRYAVIDGIVYLKSEGVSSGTLEEIRKFIFSGCEEEIRNKSSSEGLNYKQIMIMSLTNTGLVTEDTINETIS